jgi:hypothetical protein
MAALLAPAGSPEATTLRRMGFGEMVLRSDEIAVAQCVGTTSYFGGAGGRKILTDYRFELSDRAKGPHRAQLTLTLLGGRIDPFEMIVDGGPTFEIGQEVILFTRTDSGDRHVLTGYTQGVFPVVVEAGTGRRFVLPRGFAGVRFLVSPGRPPQGDEPGRQPVELQDFLDLVRDIDRHSRPAVRNPVAESPGRADAE